MKLDTDDKTLLAIGFIALLFVGFTLTILAMVGDSKQTCWRTFKDRPAADVIAVCGSR